MRKLLITVCLLALFLEISGMLFSGESDKPNQAMVALSEAPERTIQDPRENGYLLLLGFASAPSTDPVQMGLEIWLEAELDRGRKQFDYHKDSRSYLGLRVDALQYLEPIVGSEPLLQLNRSSAHLRRALTDAPTFLERYERWLNMPFEDWGYAHLGNPRLAEVFVAHRLYVGVGFARSQDTGLSRLERDLREWRAVMEKAKTLELKMLAAVIVDENTAIASDLLGRSGLSRWSPPRLQRLARPVSETERSLMWPIRNEFVRGMTRPVQVIPSVMGSAQEDSERQTEWLAKMAGLPPDTFRKTGRPLSSSVAGITFRSQRNLNMYAVYYESILKADEAGQSPLPRLREVARNSPRTLIDTFVHPIHDDPPWELVVGKMMETDARTRLAALQTTLRLPSYSGNVPARVAHAGQAYYDPFTGGPMMWNAERQRLYSVGRDGLDDAGDDTFDVAVQVVLGELVSKRKHSKSRPGTSGTRRARSTIRLSQRVGPAHTTPSPSRDWASTESLATLRGRLPSHVF